MSKLTRLTIRFLLLLLALWIGISPRVVPWLYYPRLFHPELHKESKGRLHSIAGYSNKEVYFNSPDGNLLHGWLFIHPRGKKIFLVNPGNSGNMATHAGVIELLLGAGASVFIYEYRGFGESQGTPSIDAICTDGLAAFDFLVNVAGYSPDQIVHYGVSLGCGVTTYVSTKRPCAGLILQSGFASLQRIARERVPFLRTYPSWLFPSNRLDNVRILSQAHSPLLIVHGEKDNIIPFAHSEELFSKAVQPKQFLSLPNSGHADLQTKDRALLLGAISSFLARLP